MLFAIFGDDHRDEVTRGGLVEMILLGISAIPRAKGATKNDSFSTRQKHLSGADREAISAIRIATFVGQSHGTNPRAHVS